METFIIRFPSVTSAQKGQKILEQNGFRSRLTRAGTRGCAYGLEITAPSADAALRILEDTGVIFTS